MSIKKKNITGILSLLSFVVFSAISYASFSQTVDGRLDFFSYKLNNYNFSNYQTDFVNPIFSAEKEYTIAHGSLIQYFHYNFMVGGCREVINEDIELEFKDGYTIKTAFVGQDVFTITSKVDEHEYIIERNMFHSYYKDEIFKNGVNYTSRYGTDTFIFLSEKIANDLVSHYGLQDFEDPYAELITNENLCVANFIVNGEKTELRCCINNIVYSNIKQGVRTQELYGDFILGHFNNNLIKRMTSRFELDLKVDPFGNKTCFKVFDNLDYNISNSKFSFRTYDKRTQSYIENEEMNKRYVEIWANENDFLFISVGVFSGLIGAIILGVCIYLSRKKHFLDKVEYISFFGRLGIFTIYGVIGCLIYIYPWGTLVPIAYLIMTLFEIKKIKRGFKSRKENAVLLNETDFTIINI